MTDSRSDEGQEEPSPFVKSLALRMTRWRVDRHYQHPYELARMEIQRFVECVESGQQPSEKALLDLAAKLRRFLDETEGKPDRPPVRWFGDKLARALGFTGLKLRKIPMKEKAVAYFVTDEYGRLAYEAVDHFLRLTRYQSLDEAEALRRTLLEPQFASLEVEEMEGLIRDIGPFVSANQDILRPLERMTRMVEGILARARKQN